ncbi:MAG: S-layer homology domain-containing protein, partial [Oscillospiraceae bacterium]|nr:S-layer homology domain-containing protein [Oscillospiraceae bacterium]
IELVKSTGNTPLVNGETSDALPVAVGANTFTVRVTSADGSETKDYTVVITRETAATTPGATQPDTITVWFEFTGDDIHYTFTPGSEKKDPDAYTSTGAHNPKPWISRRQVTVPTGSTVKYVTDMLLMNSGIDFSSRDMGTYIDWVRIPASSGNKPAGEKLEEFSNGPNSGWMYRYDGYIANEGYATRELQNGTQILWFYTDDYLLEKYYEPGNWGFTPGVVDSPSGGDKDKDDAGADATTPNDNTPPAPEVVEQQTIETAPVKPDESGKATVEVKTEDVTAAVTEAKKAVETAKAEGKTNAVAEIVIPVKVEGDAAVKTIEADLPAESVKAIAEAKDIILTVESSVSTITLDTATVAAIADAAKDDDTVTLTAATVDNAEALNAKQQDKVGDNPVVELNISVGDTAITSFGGAVTVSVPYTPKPETAAEDYDLLTVYYLDDDGNITEMKGATYDAKTGKITFKTNHFSKFFVAEWISPFNDIKKGEWYYKAARYTYSNDLITGVTDTTFAPQSNLTRAMLVTILYRSASVGGDVHIAPPSSGASFADVPANQWYSDAIAWASANGIVNGVGDNCFAPDENVTREQFAAILYNYAKYKKQNVTATTNLAAFTDAGEISGWALDALKWANATGLITGRTSTTLAPQGTATRAEAATLLKRYMENVG